MAEKYGEWTDWLLCVGIAVLLRVRLPMRNPDGHSPRYWRRHPKAAQPPADAPLVANTDNRQLSRGDTWSILGVLLGVLFVIVLPPLYAKVPIFVLVCIGLGWLAHRSHWVVGWSVVQTSCLALLVVIICSAIAVPQFVSQWRSEHSAVQPPPTAAPVAVPNPDLQYLPLSLRATGGFGVASKYQGKSDGDVLLIFEGKVTNNGAPSVTNDWRCRVLMPYATVDSVGYLMETSTDNDKDITFVDPDGKVSALPFSAYLPNLTATNPIPQGGSQPGFVAFVFHRLVKRRTAGALNGATVTLSFRDNTGKQYVYDQTLGPSNWAQFNPDSELVPGMPRPHKAPH
jgi:hypothetical protein